MKGITPNVCSLSVCVIINKRSFESFMCLDLASDSQKNLYLAVTYLSLTHTHARTHACTHTHTHTHSLTHSLTHTHTHKHIHTHTLSLSLSFSNSSQSLQSNYFHTRSVCVSHSVQLRLTGHYNPDTFSFPFSLSLSPFLSIILR